MQIANTHAAQVFQQVTANWPSGEPDEEQRLVSAIEALSQLDPNDLVFVGGVFSDPERVSDRLDYLQCRLVYVRHKNRGKATNLGHIPRAITA